MRQKVSAPEALLKQARRQAAELLNSMDLATEEEAFCGQLEALLSQAQQKNNSPAGPVFPGNSLSRKGRGEKGQSRAGQRL